MAKAESSSPEIGNKTRTPSPTTSVQRALQVLRLWPIGTVIRFGALSSGRGTNPTGGCKAALFFERSCLCAAYTERPSTSHLRCEEGKTPPASFNFFTVCFHFCSVWAPHLPSKFLSVAPKIKSLMWTKIAASPCLGKCCRAGKRTRRGWKVPFGCFPEAAIWWTVVMGSFLIFLWLLWKIYVCACVHYF